MLQVSHKKQDDILLKHVDVMNAIAIRKIRDINKHSGPWQILIQLLWFRVLAAYNVIGSFTLAFPYLRRPVL